MPINYVKGLSIESFDDEGKVHLNNRLASIERAFNSLMDTVKLLQEPAVDDTAPVSDQGYQYFEPITVEPEIPPEEPPGDAPLSMAGFSPVVELHKNGKHAVVDISAWQGVVNPRWIGTKVYASTEATCKIIETNLKKKDSGRNTMIEVTRLTQKLTYDFRCVPLYLDATGKEADGIASD